MMDIDNFKYFNDTDGHQMGDEVLKADCTRVLREIVRADDIAARYGGEEFVLILPETDLEKAMASAEKIRQYIENLEIPHSKESLRVTISLGVATFPLHAGDEETLIRCADGALYDAKRAAKNRVSMGRRTKSTDPEPSAEQAIYSDPSIMP